MAKEIKSQRLMQLLQITANPMLAPFMKFEHIAQDIATSLECDPTRYVNNPTEAALYAQIIGTAGGVSMAGAPSPPAVDASGSGNATIGNGAPSPPGTQGFQGNKDNSTSADSASA